MGGPGTFSQSLQAVRIGGAIAQVGVLSPAGQPLPIAIILHRQVRIQGIYVGSRADFVTMNQTISAGGLRPVIDRMFDFGEVPHALQCMQRGAHLGKIVIQVVT